ncbi:sporulation integral membrane protein YtvI [Paenisporosarcina cavernae]|uniref:Sporulation integral membrane protein YtvI n=1 Tax=Paenisporosarcina cavernae TaxID=2320858 RepID=A0A385YU87_9BACL|nr:sporulation integral membrane protein YtvI [Paenisporosarcina cavernae]AYC29132.1 sporulation integral membrane protein YtvI [Paenisporosarcina cavernae]
MPKWFNKKLLIILSIIIIAILLVVFILPLAIPIILALLTSFLLEPLVKLAKKTFKWNRKPAVILVFISFLIIVSLLVYWAITQLVAQIIQLAKVIPDYFKSLATAWDTIQARLLYLARDMPPEVVTAMKDQMNDLVKDLQGGISNLISNDSITTLVTEIPNFLVSFIVFLIALFLFMLDLTELKKTVFRHLSPASAEKMRFMMSRLNSVVFGFMKAQILVSFIILAASLIGLWIIAPKYAIVMSLIIWIVDVIPILGSIIIVAPWAIYQYATGDAVMGTKLAIFAAILLIIRRTVEPKVMGSQIGLSPLATLIAMFIGLKLFGFLGFFIGPLVVIIFTTAKEAGIIKTNFKL